MDEYTQKTKIWLNERYKKCDEKGIYYAHQPIYGFRKGHSEPNSFGRYVKTYHILKLLSHLKFKNFLDVGAAEGYQAHIVRKIFGTHVKSSDLSEEACKRTKEIFNINSDPVDIHDLPYKDNQFDVVLCSETLEHVSRYDKAIYELLRVARTAIIITVPHESNEVIDKNIKTKVPHGHIHKFTNHSFDFLVRKGYQLIYKKISSKYLNRINILLESKPMVTNQNNVKNIILFIYYSLFAVFNRFFGRIVMECSIRLDNIFCKIMPLFNSYIYVILKIENNYFSKSFFKIAPYQILNIKVPYYYLFKKE